MSIVVRFLGVRVSEEENHLNKQVCHEKFEKVRELDIGVSAPEKSFELTISTWNYYKVMAGLESLFIPYITYISRALRGDRNDLMTSVVLERYVGPTLHSIVGWSSSWSAIKSQDCFTLWVDGGDNRTLQRLLGSDQHRQPWVKFSCLSF